MLVSFILISQTIDFISVVTKSDAHTICMYMYRTHTHTHTHSLHIFIYVTGPRKTTLMVEGIKFSLSIWMNRAVS